MEVETSTLSAATGTVEIPADLASDLASQTGVAVRFFGLDGLPAGQPFGDAGPGLGPDSPLAALAREALTRSEDRFEHGPKSVRAAWLIRVRHRAVLAAAAEVPVAGEEGVALARPLLAAVAEAVRARVESAAAATECEAVSKTLLQSFEEVSLLHHLGEVLRVTRPVEELLQYVCGELRDTIDAEAAVAYMPESDAADAKAVVAGELPFHSVDLSAVVRHLLSEVGSEQLILVNNHCQEDPVLRAMAPRLARVVLVPLALREGVRGALMAVNRPAEEFGSPDAKLIRSASSASAIVIENRRLYRELQEMMIDLVRSLVSSIDAKDPYTSGHSERVSVMCRLIAEQMALEPEQIEQVYLAGLLHDIGKIGTPETILHKEGRLEPSERLIIIRHPEVGSRILAGIKKLEPIRAAVLHHHERLDGSGYPFGLKGDQIPLLARIVSLADVFDAMTSNRPYRPMLPLEQVRREIERGIGTQFDTRAGQAMLSLDLERLMREFAEPRAAVAATS